MGKTNLSRTEIILRVLAGAAMLSVALVAPNAVQMFAPLINPKHKRQTLYGYRQVIYKLEQRGLIEFKANRHGVKCAALTPKGEAELHRYDLGQLKIKQPKKWDGKYRIIIFDIKEWKRGTRDELRRWLLELGFRKLQNSVWVYPHECEEVIALLKAHFKIGKDVLYITADQIENDHWLKKEFSLV